MKYQSLRDFIAHLEAEGRLVRVSAPVSPDLEMTEIQTRLMAESGPAVLFENPRRVFVAHRPEQVARALADADDGSTVV